MVTRDFRIGDSDPWPDVVRLHREMPTDARIYILRERAMPTYTYVDEQRAIGHESCGACGATIRPLDRFCGHCGTEVYR